VGSADIYGLTTLTPADLPDVVSNAPPGAIAAVVRMDVGPTGYSDDYDGFDMVLFVNLTGESLPNPKFGTGSFLVDLKTRGVANNPDFGGGGPVTLASLESDEVWATLVPDGTTTFNAAVEGESELFLPLSDGEAFYIVSIDCPWDCNEPPDGLVGVQDFLAMLAQWGGPGSCDFDGNDVVNVGDFLVMLAQWGPCP